MSTRRIGECLGRPGQSAPCRGRGGGGHRAWDGGRRADQGPPAGCQELMTGQGRSGGRRTAAGTPGTTLRRQRKVRGQGDNSARTPWASSSATAGSSPSGASTPTAPPGQYHTERFPVLHVGDVPTSDLGEWTRRLRSRRAPLTSRWTSCGRSASAIELITDIHCVTKWSKFDTVWNGVRVRDLFDRAGVRPTAHARHHARGVRLHRQRPPRRHAGRHALARVRATTASRSKVSTDIRCASDPASVLLEVGEVGARHRAASHETAGLLGAQRLPQLRRPLRGAALHRAMSRSSGRGGRRRRRGARR